MTIITGTTDLPAALCTVCSNAQRHLQHLYNVRQAAASLVDRYPANDLPIVRQAHQSLKEWVAHLRSPLPGAELAEHHIAKHVADNALLQLHAAKVLLQVLSFKDEVIADTIAFAFTRTHAEATAATTEVERLWKLWESGAPLQRSR